MERKGTGGRAQKEVVAENKSGQANGKGTVVRSFFHNRKGNLTLLRETLYSNYNAGVHLELQW